MSFSFRFLDGFVCKKVETLASRCLIVVKSFGDFSLKLQNHFLTYLALIVCLKRGIPHNFIRSISDKDFSFKMVLNLPWGSSWPVKISCNPNFYYMEKRGWDQFVSDNALGDNEFLTFTHKGNMCFSVNIYQIDCKEMLRLRKSATIASSSGKFPSM